MTEKSFINGMNYLKLDVKVSNNYELSPDEAWNMTVKAVKKGG